MPADIALQGSETGTWELLEGKEEKKSVFDEDFYLSGSLVFDGLRPF